MLGLVLSTAPFATALFGAPSPALPACTAPGGDRTEPLDGGLAALPLGWTAEVSLDDGRIPAIPSIVATDALGTSCDLTADLDGFLDRAGVTDRTQVASLAVQTSFPDYVGVPEVRDVAFDGDVAHVTTWSEKDGLVVDWTVNVETLETHFEVLDRAVGDYTFDVEGWHPWVGFVDGLIEPLHEEGAADKHLTVTNNDGLTTWTINYFTSLYASEAEADSYADAYGEAAKVIYDIQATEWGFTSVDPDADFDVTANGCNCIFAGDDTDIHVSAKLEELAADFGLVYPSPDHFYRVVIGHEFHHHLQWSANGWAGGGAAIEGPARFSETAFEPEGTHGPDTIQYLPNINGFSNVCLNPNEEFDDRLYDLGIYWGFLWEQNGGPDFLRAVYDHMPDDNSNDAIPAAIEAAFDELGGGSHDTFEASYLDFGAHLMARDLVWADRNWADFLPACDTTPASAPGGGSTEVGGANIVLRGLQFAEFTPVDDALVAYSADEPIRGLWAVVTADGLQTVETLPAQVFDHDGVERLVLVTTETDAAGGTSPVPFPLQIGGAGEARATVTDLGGLV